MPPGPSNFIHTLTATFASTLDEIPQDMCRHFADLRELDAVLSQSLGGITKRIEELTEQIEGGLAALEKADGSGDDRNNATKKEEEIVTLFANLHGIAEDSNRIKLGGEDKIRVASLAVEHMDAYYQHLLTITRKMYEMDASYNLEVLAPYTTYPHVPPAALVDPAPENRRGAPRRMVAVQNNSYNLPYAAQNPRNESTQRGVIGVRERDGESPNKRRRIGTGRGDAGGAAGGETDDYSTPRRGLAAIDAEAYRPGGNTASRARQQVKRVREGRQNQPQNMETGSVIDAPISRGEAGHPGLGMDPSNMMPAPAPTGGSKGGGRRTGSSQNPPPQAYPMSYNAYPPTQPPSNSSNNRNQYNSTSTAAYDSYPQQNLNPVMDAATAAGTAYHISHPSHGYSSLNMNPNINRMNSAADSAQGGGYPSSHSGGGMGGGMGMLIPTQLPPPPSASNGRPGSGGVSKNTYDVPPENTGGSRNGGGYGGSSKAGRNTDLLAKEREVNGPGSSAQGGLMPVPMLTSLPPVTSFTQSAPLSMNYTAPPPEPSHRSAKAYSGYGNGAYENSAPGGGYGSGAAGYPPTSGRSEPSSAGGYNRDPIDKRDVHPSLMSNGTKDSHSHNRDPSLPSAGAGRPNSAGSAPLHASLAREPPFRTNSAGSAGERLEKERHTAPARPRSGTASGGPTPYPPLDNHATGAGLDREREKNNHSAGSGYGRHPSLVGPANAGATGAAGGMQHPSLSHSSSRSSGYGYGVKDEPFVTKPDDREYASHGHGVKRNFDRMMDVDERVYNERPGREGEVDMAMEEKPARVPARRKTMDSMFYGVGQGARRHVDHVDRDRDGDDGEGQADDDSRPYCICARPSYGLMVQCDNSDCDYEWFHIDCLGMTEAPEGAWKCQFCQDKEHKSEGRRPGKKKGMSGSGRGRGV